MRHHQDLVQQALQLLVHPVKTKEALPRHQALAPISSAIQPGDNVEWTRAGSQQTGLVDFMHIDETGTPWAFVTQGEGWTAVNARYITHPPVSPDAVEEQREG